MQPGSESFVDVLSNTVGGLALLCILAALDAGNLRWRLFINEETEAETKSVIFVVQHGWMKPLELKELPELANKFPAGEHFVPATPEFAFSVKLTKRGLDETDFDLINSEEVPGDSIEDFLASRGPTFDRLQQLDGDSHHVFFYLAPDAFADYMRLRDHCNQMGLNVGWKPLEGDLSFTVGGSDEPRPGRPRRPWETVDEE